MPPEHERDDEDAADTGEGRSRQPEVHGDDGARQAAGSSADAVPTLVDLSPPGAIPASVSLPDAEAASAELARPQRDEVSAAPSGRTAFDALNPYGDFGGSEPSSARLAVVAVLSVFAISFASLVLFIWAKDTYDAMQRDRPVAAATSPPPEAPPAASDAPATGTSGEPDSPLASGAASEPAEPADDDSDVTAQAEKQVDTSATKEEERPPAAPPQRARRAPAPPPLPPPVLVLLASRDRSSADVEGLDAPLKKGFLVRLAALAPDAVVQHAGRPTERDVSVKLVLQRLHEGKGTGVPHEVTAHCEAGVRPRTAVRGGLDREGRARGDNVPALRREAAFRCGAALADALAPVARSLK